jgi:hypothetical protein
MRLIESLRFLPTGSPEPTPALGISRLTIDDFGIPFELDVPTDLSLTEAVDDRLVSLTTPLFGAGDAPIVFHPVYRQGRNGLVVALATGGSVDRCPRGIGGVSLTPGADVLRVMEGSGGIHSTTTPVTIDGRSAVIASMTADCLDHLHVHGLTNGSQTLNLTRPATQSYFLPLGDQTVLIQIWAASAAEFELWLPIAEEIVASIHFTAVD